MKYLNIIAIALLASACSKAPLEDISQETIVTPANSSRIQVQEFHGYKHVDEYYYLEQQNADETPVDEVQSIIDEENAKSEAFFAQYEDELNVIYQEMLNRRPKGMLNNIPYSDDEFTYANEF